MSTNADIGYSTTLSINGSAVGDITNISPAIEKGEVDVSAMDDATLWKTYISSRLDATVEVSGHFIPATNDTDMLAYVASESAYAVLITWPDGTVWSFDALILSFDADAPDGDKMTFTSRMRVTGAVDTSA